MTGDKVIAKPWESRHFGCPVYQIEPSEAVSWDKFVYSLVQAEDTTNLFLLECEGFKILMPMVELEVIIPPFNSPENVVFRPNKYVRKAVISDVPRLKEIASTSFENTRLHASTSKRIADAMHAEWAENCFNKSQADETLVFEFNGKVVGFIAMRVQDAIGDIVLIAVDKEARGKGIGRALVNAGCDLIQAEVNRIFVRTELANSTSIRMYESCGFRFKSGLIYMGKWS
jgi:ribosomal protein S18 acetylase RimI-like enzyme